MTDQIIAALTDTTIETGIEREMLDFFGGYGGGSFMDEVRQVTDALIAHHDRARDRTRPGRYVYDVVVDSYGVIDGMNLGVETTDGARYVLPRDQSDLTVDRDATGASAAIAIHTAIQDAFNRAETDAVAFGLTCPRPRTQPATMREALANLDERGEYTSLIDVSLRDLLEVGESDGEFDAGTSRVDMLAVAQVHDASAWCLSYEVKAVRDGRAYVLVSNGIREYVESEGLVDLDDPESVEDYLADIENND